MCGSDQKEIWERVLLKGGSVHRIDNSFSSQMLTHSNWWHSIWWRGNKKQRNRDELWLGSNRFYHHNCCSLLGALYVVELFSLFLFYRNQANLWWRWTVDEWWINTFLIFIPSFAALLPQRCRNVPYLPRGGRGRDATLPLRLHRYAGQGAQELPGEVVVLL